MSEPRKKRTSRPTSDLPPAVLENVDGAEFVEAAPGSVLRDVKLAGSTTMKVDTGAVVDKWVDLERERHERTVRIHADARVTDVRVVQVRDHYGEAVTDESTIVIHRGAWLLSVLIEPIAIDIFDGAEVTGRWQTPRKSTTTLVDRVSIGGSSKVTDVHLRDVSIGARSIVKHCQLAQSSIGDDCEVHDLAPDDRIQIGSGSRIDGRADRSRSSFVRFEAAVVGLNTHIHHDVSSEPETEIGHDCIIGPLTRIGRDCRIGDGVKIGDPTIHEASDGEQARIGDDVHIGAGTTIGFAVHIATQVKIGTNVHIDDGAAIDKYAVVSDGVRIGHHAHIKSGVRVRKDVGDNEVVETAVASLPDVTVHANAESWMLSRVADAMEAAGQKRLDKRVLARDMPTLVEAHCVKQLLRMAPPPDVALLRSMAKAFACTPKYVGTSASVHVKPPPPYLAQVKPAGWSGMQVMGDYDNDVILFKTTPEVLDSIFPGGVGGDFAHMATGRPWQRGFLRALMTLGKTSNHPGGTDPYVIGWARTRFDEDHRSVLCEELQTDLAFLAWDPSMEVWYLAGDAATLRFAPAGPPSAIPDPLNVFSMGHAIAEMLTKEGVPANDWGRHVRGQMDRGEVPSNEPRVILPSFTKDKTIQQQALMALVFWESSRIHHAEAGGEDEFYNPDVEGFDGPTARIYKFVALDILGKWGDISERMRSRGSTILSDPQDVAAIELAQATWPQEAAQIVDAVRGTFGDFYESALAGVLQLARKAGMREVWVPDYETKYAIASYAGSEGAAPLEPPRSVYTELPKKFGVTQVERLPSYMDTSVWQDEADERRRAKWPRVEIPREPRGRRLLANRDR